MNSKFLNPTVIPTDSPMVSPTKHHTIYDIARADRELSTFVELVDLVAGFMDLKDIRSCGANADTAILKQHTVPGTYLLENITDDL